MTQATSPSPRACLQLIANSDPPSRQGRGPCGLKEDSPSLVDWPGGPAANSPLPGAPTFSSAGGSTAPSAIQSPGWGGGGWGVGWEAAGGVLQAGQSSDLPPEASGPCTCEDSLLGRASGGSAQAAGAPTHRCCSGARCAARERKGCCPSCRCKSGGISAVGLVMARVCLLDRLAKYLQQAGAQVVSGGGAQERAAGLWGAPRSPAPSAELGLGPRVTPEEAAAPAPEHWGGGASKASGVRAPRATAAGARAVRGSGWLEASRENHQQQSSQCRGRGRSSPRRARNDTRVRVQVCLREGRAPQEQLLLLQEPQCLPSLLPRTGAEAELNHCKG